MGKSKDIRKQIKGLQRQVAAHRAKIGRESQAEHPNFGRIAHWESEIEVWKARVEKLQRRLGEKGKSHEKK